jgi:hypothetical protein
MRTMRYYMKNGSEDRCHLAYARRSIMLQLFDRVKEKLSKVSIFKEAPNLTFLSAIAILGLLGCLYTGKISSIVVQTGAVIVEILGK